MTQDSGFSWWHSEGLEKWPTKIFQIIIFVLVYEELNTSYWGPMYFGAGRLSLILYVNVCVCLRRRMVPGLLTTMLYVCNPK